MTLYKIMQIAIISDTHDNLPNLKKVLGYCRKEKIEKLIHCGDLATMETLKFLNDNFSGEIFFTFGNMDDAHIAEDLIGINQYKQIQIFRDFGHTEIVGQKIAFVHYPDAARHLCESGEYEYVFYGHTHKPWDEIVNNCHMMNPGNVANQYYPPTFAIWNTSDNNIELIRINQLSQ